MIKPLYILLIFFLLPINSYSKEELSLTEAIRIAIKRNPQVKQIQANLAIKEMEHEINKVNFFFPGINLSGSLTSSHDMGGAQGFSNGKKDTTKKSEGNSNEARIDLSMNDLVLYNSGRDKDTLKLSELNLKDAKLSAKGNLRNFVIEIIANYYIAYLGIEKVNNIKNKSVLANSILQLAKQKSNGRVAGEVLFAKTELLDAQRDLSVEKFRLKKAFMDLNKIMFVDLEKEYKLTTKLVFKPLKIKYDYLKNKIENAIEMKKIKLRYKIDELNLKRRWKDRFPLPTVSITGLSYGYGKGEDGTGRNFSFNGRSSSNLDLQVGINWTMPIWGSGGLFDSLNYKRAQTEVKVASFEILNTRKSLEYDMFTAFHELESQTEQIKITKESLENLSGLLDITLQNYQKGKATRERLKDVLDELTSVNEVYLTYLLSYYLLKVGIAKRINDDRLIGELKIAEEGIKQ